MHYLRKIQRVRYALKGLLAAALIFMFILFADTVGDTPPKPHPTTWWDVMSVMVTFIVLAATGWMIGATRDEERRARSDFLTEKVKRGNNAKV